MKIREVIKINDEKDTSVRKGGTGYVVKAEFKTQELIEKHGFSTVAVKFFEKSNIENFRFEVMLMGALPSSPFIVKMLGYCEDPMGIIMKYYPLNLDHLLASPKFCEPADVKIKLASDIAEGMNILHSHDIIHFDLKPGMYVKTIRQIILNSTKN